MKQVWHHRKLSNNLPGVQLASDNKGGEETRLSFRFAEFSESGARNGGEITVTAALTSPSPGKFLD